jgi:hypothetical protein
MPKDNESHSDLDLQVIYPPQGLPSSAGPAPTVAPPPNNNGYAVISLGAVQAQAPQPVVQSPGLVVLAVGSKKDDDKAKKAPEMSSVFLRL